VVQEAVV
jgi:hypothetical protein